MNATCKKGAGCCAKCGPSIITASISGSATYRDFEGKKCLVVPVVAIVEGVLNDFLVPESEFAHFADAWEGVPVPVSHPEANGQPVSANRPDILEKYAIGRFHNVAAGEKKLRGELWIDCELAQKKGFGDLVKDLHGGKKIEVSTAYFADTEDKAGEFNGVPYRGVHRNLRPDHLALLPDQVGACSLEDGCGTFQNAEKKEEKNRSEKKAGNGNKNNKKNRSNPVDLQELVAAIIESGKTGFTQDDAEMLAGLGEDVLKKILPASTNEAADNKEAEDKNTSSDANKIGAEELTAINWCRQQYQNARASLVKKITTNSACTFREDELQSMSTETLEKLSASLEGADYSGRGLPIANRNREHKEEALKAPGVIFQKEAAK